MDESRQESGSNVMPWENLPDPELLKWRICDLKVRIEGSPIESRVQKLYDDLAARGLSFRPPCYLATEWLTPDRIPAVGVPFYLAHPRLQRLEKSMMLEAEGEKEEECMKLLRHETGHAINYAYKLFRKTRWRELFGPMSMDYDPHSYVMKPYSRQFVIHLADNYAQVHPDEDFAETFALWLTPGVDWRLKYKGWAALKKLEYVDHIMAEIADRAPTVRGGPRYWSASRTRSTLETYYRRKQKEFGEGYKGFYDPILLKLFSREPASKNSVRAHRFLSSYRKELVTTISRWSRIPKYSVHELIKRLSSRARDLNLYLREDETTALFSVGVCINSLLLVERSDYGESET